ARRKLVQMMVAERAFQGIDDRLRQVVILRGGAEAAGDLKCDGHSPNVVLDKLARSANNAGAKSALIDRNVGVEVVAQPAQVTRLGVLVEHQRMALAQ